MEHNAAPIRGERVGNHLRKRFRARTGPAPRRSRRLQSRRPPLARRDERRHWLWAREATPTSSSHCYAYEQRPACIAPLRHGAHQEHRAARPERPRPLPPQPPALSGGHRVAPRAAAPTSGLPTPNGGRVTPRPRGGGGRSRLGGGEETSPTPPPTPPRAALAAPSPLTPATNPATPVAAAGRRWEGRGFDSRRFPFLPVPLGPHVRHDGASVLPPRALPGLFLPPRTRLRAPLPPRGAFPGAETPPRPDSGGGGFGVAPGAPGCFFYPGDRDGFAGGSFAQALGELNRPGPPNVALPEAAAAFGGFSGLPEAEAAAAASSPSPEREQAERRRLRNRLAASRCRRRKLERIARLEQRVRGLRAQNAALAAAAAGLRAQVRRLRGSVRQHLGSGCPLPAGSEPPLTEPPPLPGTPTQPRGALNPP
ncbi:transcription factor JunB-like [Phaenicophaeus curvirostris]|uniref:transcription factor JunB-like n=1 Tax=Phaenicophaeus curvirostris TaxID=33595 RepID=UPI0037F0EDB7